MLWYFKKFATVNVFFFGGGGGEWLAVDVVKAMFVSCFVVVVGVA